MTLPRLLVLTDRHQLPAGRDLVSTLRSCHGDFAVLLRELDLPWPERERLAFEIAQFAPVISAREVLRATIGTHLSSSQPAPGLDACGAPPFETRPSDAPQGETSLWGRSCHSVDEVRSAADTGASWVTLGPVAESLTKPGYGPAVETTALSEAAAMSPVFALGGVTPENASALMGLGIHGVAVMGAVMRADDPAAVVSALLEAA